MNLIQNAFNGLCLDVTVAVHFRGSMHALVAMATIQKATLTERVLLLSALSSPDGRCARTKISNEERDFKSVTYSKTLPFICHYLSVSAFLLYLFCFARFPFLLVLCRYTTLREEHIQNIK